MIYIVICIICWGFWGLAEKLSLQHSSPLSVQFLCMLIYGSFAPFIWIYLKQRDIQINFGSVGWAFAICSLSMIASTSYMMAVGRLSVSITAGLTSTYPVITCLLCWALLGESMNPTKWVGVLLSIGGIVLLSK